MSSTGGNRTMENIEESKENVRPLRSGRKIDCIVNSANAKAELETRRSTFEAVRQQLSDNCQSVELLNAYHEYIVWIEQNYAFTDETVLKTVLEQCLDHFFKLPDKQLFINDKKLLSVFLKHTAMCNNPVDFFKSAYQSGFFKTLACFFIEWSFHYEVINDMDHAIKVLMGGVNKRAQPAESIVEAIEKLNQRKKEYQNDPSMAPSGDHRQAFNQLKVRASGLAPVDRVSNIVLPPIQNRGLRAQKSSSTSSSYPLHQSNPSMLGSNSCRTSSQPEENFMIPADGGDDNGQHVVDGPVSLPFEKQAVPQSIKGNENVIKPGKWNENALKIGGKAGKPIKEAFKVLNEAEKLKKTEKNDKIDKKDEKVDKKKEEKVDYSKFSWGKLGSLICSTTFPMSFEEIRYMKYQEKLVEMKKDMKEVLVEKIAKTEVDGKVEVEKQENFAFPDEAFVVPIQKIVPNPVKKAPLMAHKKLIPSPSPRPKSSGLPRDHGIEALEAMDSPDRGNGEFISPTELLNMTCSNGGANLCKTMDFTVSNLRTEDFNPNFGSTPQVNRTKAFVPLALSPLVEVSYKSSSSSGGYTTTKSMIGDDKSMPSDIYDYPFKAKSIRFMLKSIQNPINQRPGYVAGIGCPVYRRDWFAENDVKAKNVRPPFMIEIGKRQFLYGSKRCLMVGDGWDLLFCLPVDGPKVVAGECAVRFLEDGKWDFYVRTEIAQRLGNNSPLSGLFKNQVHFYHNHSASIDPNTVHYDNVGDLSLKDCPLVTACLVHQLVNLIQRLHSVKIVCGMVQSSNILVKFDSKLGQCSPVIDLLNLSSAIDLTILPESCLSPGSVSNFVKIDWLGLLDTVCQLIFEADIQGKDLNFKINALSNLSSDLDFERQFVKSLGSILAEMFQHIFGAESEIDLSKYKEELMKLSVSDDIIFEGEIDQVQSAFNFKLISVR